MSQLSTVLLANMNIPGGQTLRSGATQLKKEKPYNHLHNMYI